MRLGWCAGVGRGAPQEKRKLPARTDVKFPEALDLHMRANQEHKYTEEDREIHKVSEKKWSQKLMEIRSKFSK